MRAAIAAANRKIEAMCQIKSNHWLHPKQFIKDILNDVLGDTHIILQGQHPEGVDLVAIGYFYSSNFTFYFVAIKNTGSIRKEKLGEKKFSDLHSNAYAQLVDRSFVISNYFEVSNCVDKHNQACQYELALEKKWDARDPQFRLTTALIRLSAVDA